MKGKTKKHSKKSKSGAIPQKVSLAQLRNEYIRRYTRVAKALGALETYKKLSKEDHFFLWLGRVRAIRVEPEQGVKIRSQLLAFLRLFVSRLSRLMTASIVEGGPVVTLEDYFTAGVMFGIFTRTLTAEVSGKTELQVNEIKKAFQPVARHDRYQEPYTKLMAIGGMLSRTLSRPTSKIYAIRYDIHYIESYTSADCLIVNVISAPCIYVAVNGVKRQCYRLCWPGLLGDFMWGSIDGTALGIEGAFAKLKLDLYIQPHALHRLRERTAPVEAFNRFHSLYESLENPIYHKGKPGTCLLEYRVDNTRIGYFLIEVVGGVALIKTFLFVTNSGTPEGTRLDRILGSRKVDKEYTGIDTLSTLVNTDILQNSTLRSAFIEAGLESLIGFCAKIPVNANRKKGFSSFFDLYMGFPSKPSEQQTVEVEEEVTVV